MKLRSLFSANSHVVPSGPLLVLLDNRFDMGLEITDVLSKNNQAGDTNVDSIAHTSLAETHFSFGKSL